MYLTLTLISGSVAAHGECALFCCDLSGRLGCGTLYRGYFSCGRLGSHRGKCISILCGDLGRTCRCRLGCGSGSCLCGCGSLLLGHCKCCHSISGLGSDGYGVASDREGFKIARLELDYDASLFLVVI